MSHSNRQVRRDSNMHHKLTVYLQASEPWEESQNFSFFSPNYSSLEAWSRMQPKPWYQQQQTSVHLSQLCVPGKDAGVGGGKRGSIHREMHQRVDKKKKKEVCPPASLEFPCQCNKIALYLMDSKQRGRGKKRYIEIGLDIEKWYPVLCRRLRSISLCQGKSKQTVWEGDTQQML